MNAERLLALYERVAEAPDAITRLRRFILDLAVRGKLVPQDSQDEPASELLKRIAQEKARLVKAGEIRKPKPLAPLERADTPLVEETPGWHWVRLGSVATLITKGSTPTSYGHAYTDQGVNFIKVESIRNSQIRREDITSFISAETNEFLSRSRLEEGDILFSIAGSIGTCAVVSATVLPANTNQALAIIRGTHVVFSNRFLLNALRSSVSNSIQILARGGAMNNVSLEDIHNFVVPVPPLAEQHRIVAKVDELMALCDQLKAARQEREALRDRLAAASLVRLNAPDPETFQSDARFTLNALPALTTRPNQIKQLRQTILNLAVRGKLVPQDPNDEPAATLSERLAKKFAKEPIGIGRGRRSEIVAGLIEKAPYLVPSGWLWVRMGDLGETNIGLTYSPVEISSAGIPVLRSNNIQAGKIHLSDLVRVTSKPKPSAMVSEGDLLICARNGSRSLVGKAAIIERLSEPMAFGAFMAIFRSPVNRYLHLFLSSPVFRQVIDEVNTNTINQITQANLRSTLISLPPLAEQHRIVAKVDELMALCDRLEASLTTSDQTRTRLLEATLAEALAPASISEMESAE
jgi:type I restriction enzyme S subunit